MKKSPSAPDFSQWTAPAQSGQTLKPGLYIVATPIGNLRDITLRALDVLAAAACVYCEDTRVTQKLLDAYGLKKKLVRCDAHTEKTRATDIAAEVAGGSIVALTSDAGTPCISDPGSALVAECRAKGIEVFPIPGPNAAMAALSASGLTHGAFSFIGFLPPRQAARRQALHPWKHIPSILVVYESANRVAALLQDIEAVLGPRALVIGRELTKRFERFYHGTPRDLLPHIGEANFKGEVVLLIAPEGKGDAFAGDEWEDSLQQALSDHSLREAVALITAQTGLPRKTVYAKALLMGKKN